MKYTDAMDYIAQIQVLGIVPGLASITQLCRRIGDPQDTLQFVHVAGTNGKGSVIAYLSTILTAAGYRVGRYISPTIFAYRERIQVNGRDISQKAFGEGMEVIRAACQDMTGQGLPHPTPFEVETALAFWYFREKKCDIVVLETGMGGLYDATNLIRNTQVAVLASISMDHMQYLGGRLADIAAHKAGILKEGRPAVSALQPPEAMEVSGPSADQAFEERLKRFMQESDNRMADKRQYFEHRSRSRRR